MEKYEFKVSGTGCVEIGAHLGAVMLQGFGGDGEGRRRFRRLAGSIQAAWFTIGLSSGLSRARLGFR